MDDSEDEPLNPLEGATCVSEEPRHRGSPEQESAEVRIEPAPDPVTPPLMLARALALAVVIEGAAVLVGWAVGNETLKSVAPGFVTMKVNTAITLVALGASVLVPWRWAKAALGAVVIAVTTAVLTQFLFDVDLGIDEFFIADPDSLGNPPGRMAPMTAISLLTIEVAAIAPGPLRRTLLNSATALAVAFGYVALLGYCYGVDEFFTVTPYSAMAFHTAAGITLLAIAVNMSDPKGALAYVATSARPGAAMLRRITPVAGLLIPAIGYLLLEGRDAGWYDSRSADAKVVAFSALVLLVTAGFTARTIDRIDDQKLRYQAELLELTESLEEGLSQEWQRAENLVRDLYFQRQRFEQAISKVDDLVWTVEIVGSGAIQTMYNSTNGQGVFGGSVPEGADVTAIMAELVDSDYREALSEFNRSLAAGTPAEVEVRTTGFDGVTRWLWLRGAPRREGRRLFFDGITTNVTERRVLADQQAALLEAEVAHVQRLKELNRAREEFIATASHELRTPLTVIQGFSELLTGNDEVMELAGHQVETIKRRAEHLAHLVDDMFDLTKFAAGMVTMSFVPVQIDHLLEDTVANLQPAALEAGLELDLSCEARSVEVDLTRFHQALDNVIGNALKYTPRGGNVRVVGRVEGDHYAISVTDTGVGVGVDQLEMIFDPHFRAKTATDNAIPGTGLGLAITRAIVEAHGGSIAAKNGTDHGLEVTFNLPLLAAGAAHVDQALMAAFASSEA